MPLNLKFCGAVVLAAALIAWVAPAQAQNAFVGLQIQGVEGPAAKLLDLKGDLGVLVKDVAVGEPGAIAGIQRGDRIVQFNRKNIANFSDIVNEVGRTKAGKKVSITVIRDGKNVKLTLRSGKRPQSWNITRFDFRNFRDIGITVSSLTERVREQFGIRWGATGLVITIVDRNKQEFLGLLPGEVIHQVNQRNVWRPSQLNREIEQAKSANTGGVLLLIEGVNGYRYQVLPVGTERIQAGPPKTFEFAGMRVHAIADQIAGVLGLEGDRGVLVGEVKIGGAAALAGFRPGDRILRFDGDPIPGLGQFAELAGESRRGRTIDIHVSRNRREAELEMRVPDVLRDDNPAAASVFELPEFGVSVQRVNDNLREELPIRWSSGNLAVTNVDETKPIATGLRRGDVIWQVDLNSVYDGAGLKSAVDAARAADRKEVLVLLENPSGFRYSILPVN